MASKSRAKKAAQVNLPMEKGKGMMSSDKQKEKSMDAILRISEMEIGDDAMVYQEEILSPRSVLKSLPQQAEVRVQFSKWLEVIHGRSSENQRKEGTINPVPILFSPEEQIGNANDI